MSATFAAYLCCALIAVMQAADTDHAASTYRLGIDDQITISVAGLTDIPDKPFRVAPSGTVDVPLLGVMNASGLTVAGFKAAVAQEAMKYIADPHVTVNVSEYKSRQVSVVGNVNNPGLQSLAGPRRLIEVLSAAGGLRPDAGSTIRITRVGSEGKLPLPGSRTDIGGSYTVADLDTSRLMASANPEENILVRNQDVISVSKADLVYVLGEVKKAGGFTLASKEQMSVLKAVSMAEGFERTAAPKQARILRPSADGVPETEIPVNIAKILDGKSRDVEMRANDILYVPNNVPRSIMLRSAETALQIGTGMVIWRR